MKFYFKYYTHQKAYCGEKISCTSVGFATQAILIFRLLLSPHPSLSIGLKILEKFTSQWIMIFLNVWIKNMIFSLIRVNIDFFPQKKKGFQDSK